MKEKAQTGPQRMERQAVKLQQARVKAARLHAGKLRAADGDFTTVPGVFGSVAHAKTHTSKYATGLKKVVKVGAGLGTGGAAGYVLKVAAKRYPVIAGVTLVAAALAAEAKATQYGKRNPDLVSEDFDFIPSVAKREKGYEASQARIRKARAEGPRVSITRKIATAIDEHPFRTSFEAGLFLEAIPLAAGTKVAAKTVVHGASKFAGKFASVASGVAKSWRLFGRKAAKATCASKQIPLIPSWQFASRIEVQLLDPRLGPLTGKLDLQKVAELANNPRANFFLDKSSGYINVIQNIEGMAGKLLRITVLRDEHKIISIGIIRDKSLLQYTTNSSRYIKLGVEQTGCTLKQ